MLFYSHLRLKHEHIRVYASKFEELNRFFKDTLTKEAVIGLFLNNVRKSESSRCRD